MSSATRSYGIRKIAVGGCLLLMLSACGPYDFGGLRPISVSAVEGVPKEISDRIRSVHSGELLQLEFGSDVNFLELADRYGYNMWVETRWCNVVGYDAQGLGYSFFFLGPIEVHTSSITDVRYPRVVETMQGAFVYRSYLRVSDTTVPLSASMQGKPFQPYDLSKDPKDVCLRVRGGNMAGIHGHSEFVRFPSEMIRDALEEK